MKYYVFILLLLGSGFCSHSQCPTVAFNSASSVCLGEKIALDQLSANAINYEWDFCINGFNEEPVEINKTDVPEIDYVGGFELVESEGNWFAFATDRGRNKLIRFNYGLSPLNLPTVTDLGNVGGLLHNPEDIELYNDNGVWYGFIGSLILEFGIVRLAFGSSLLNTPTATNIGYFGFPGRFRGLEVVRQNNDLILVLINYNSRLIIRVNYRDSFLNTISDDNIYNSGPIAGADLPIDIEFVGNCGNDSLAFLPSIQNGTIARLNFGSNVLATPTVENTYTFPGVSRPFYIKMIQEGNNYYGIVVNEDRDTRIIDFGDLNNSTPPVELTKTSNPRYQALTAYRLGGINYLQGITHSDSLLHISYESDCGSSLNYSTDNEPTGLSYNSSEMKEIWLKAIDNENNASSIVNNIRVEEQTAPSISFTSTNRCITFPISFSSSNSDLTSYSWDFDGDGTEDSNLATPDPYRYSTAGTYTARVRVSDGSCNNFHEEEIMIYDPPPLPSYNFSSTRSCTNTAITFTNTTSDETYTGTLQYTWDFNGEGSANTRNTTFSFSTPGNKTVMLTSSIPGCQEVTQQVLTVTSGPVAGFSATSACQGESVQFTNNSSGAITYSWDFGDGSMPSSTVNPNHIYTNSGNHSVTLIATNPEGCNHSEVIEITVSANPQVDFDFNTPCTRVQFSDLTTIDNADVVSWNWLVDGEQVSTEQNPTILFNSVGTREVRLSVQGSNGCESSYSEDIEVLNLPVPDFMSSLGCLGEESTFIDNTVSTDNPIVSRLWIVEGVRYGTRNIAHVFSDPGMYDVSLEVTGQNFCSEIITRTIEITESPSIRFSVNGECSNEVIRVIDETVSETPITSRRWLLDGENVGDRSPLFLENLSDDSHELMLEIETSSGCTVSESQSLEINTVPEASFASSKTYGIPNDPLLFTNTSTGGASYRWLLDGTVCGSESTSKTIRFSDPGTYRLSLIAENNLDCSDTATQEILIAIPEVDLSIGSFELVEENGVGTIFLEVHNSSNLPVELTEARIVLENQFSVTEQIPTFIDVGETELVNLNTGIPLTPSEPLYFCVILNSQYVDYPDINPIDNEKCLTIRSTVEVENPFPNPVTDQFRLKVIVPKAGKAHLMLINSVGKMIHSTQGLTANTGLNNFFLEMSTLNPGIYYVIIEVLGTVHKRRVIKL